MAPEFGAVFTGKGIPLVAEVITSLVLDETIWIV